jgi:hypothetical protein
MEDAGENDELNVRTGVTGAVFAERDTFGLDGHIAKREGSL